MDEIEAAMAEFGVDEGLLGAALSVRQRIGTAPRSPAGDRVSLCMIVKDEAAHLARCLHSVRAVVDEMVVVDTGSGDGSQDIARAFGARVIECEWEGDFAKARNRALAEATGDWVFVLDGDELISASDHAHFRGLIRKGRRSPAAYHFQTRNYTWRLNTVGFQPNHAEYASEEAGVGWYPSDKVRLFPNDPRIRFSYPVHEMVEPSLREVGIRIRSGRIPVHHYGKLHEDLSLRKTTVYRSLGTQKLAADPADPAALREAAIQASHLGQHAEALDLWQSFLRVRPESAEAHLNLASACINLQRYADAVAHAETALIMNPALKEAGFNAALANLIFGHTDRALAIITPLVAQKPDYLAARFLLAACHACSGSEARFRDTLRPLAAGPLNAYLSVSFAELAQKLLSNAQHHLASALLESAVSLNYSSPEMLALLPASRSSV
jgi:glycosyltransferase involved in cell wall biosynthesis